MVMITGCFIAGKYQSVKTMEEFISKECYKSHLKREYEQEIKNGRRADTLINEWLQVKEQ